MARTFIRQDAQIASTLTSVAGFVDNTAPAATMESGAGNIADDLNNIRSMLNYLQQIDQAGSWYDTLTAPSALEAGTSRGVQGLNDGLHALEKKRILRDVHSLVDVTVAASENWVILGSGELPAQTTAAVGAVTTLGTVVAAHGGTFGTHALSEVAGSDALSPKNLMIIVDGATRDPILSSGRQIYGLLHGEVGLVDADTITDTTDNRVQISFVRQNAAGDDLEACPVADIENKVINYCSRERVRLEDVTEAEFLRGAIVDVGSGSATIDRQNSYDNQGTTPVDLTNNAILDIEGAGLSWSIRDDLEAMLFELVEGSAGGTSQFNVGAAVDEMDVDAAVVDFAEGITVDSSATRTLQLGVNEGIIESTSGDLEIRSANEMFLDDANQAGSTWAQTAGVKLSETTAEWDAYELAFGGEVSLLNAIVQANDSVKRTRVQSIVDGSDIAADTDANGPGTPHANLTVDLPAYDQVTFVSDVDVYLNGELLRNGANAAANEDVYPGGTPADGDLAFEFALKGTGSKPDQLTVIVYGQ